MLSKRTIRIIAGVAVLWNMLGIVSYLSHVGVIGAGGPPPGGANMPMLITACFAVGVFAGSAGAVGLAFMRRWARPVLWTSLIALLIDWIWVFAFSGAASIPIGVTVLVVALLLVVLAERARQQGWLVSTTAT